MIPGSRISALRIASLSLLPGKKEKPDISPFGKEEKNNIPFLIKVLDSERRYKVFEECRQMSRSRIFRLSQVPIMF